MTEWWTYGLSDFLMFSPQVYWRLVARYNAAWWPAQVLGAAAALALAGVLRASSPRADRAALLVLALAWAWVAWAFQWQRYAEIFLGAAWLAVASAVQALLLVAAAAAPLRESGRTGGRLAAVLLGAAVLYPLLAPLAGHPWGEAEVFGLMPEPTALGTLGVIAALRGRPRWVRAALALVPVLSLVVGAATRWLIAQ